MLDQRLRFLFICLFRCYVYSPMRSPAEMPVLQTVLHILIHAQEDQLWFVYLRVELFNHLFFRLFKGIRGDQSFDIVVGRIMNLGR